MADQTGLDVWTLESEIQLFHAILNHKPVGADRHFQMIYHDSEVNPFQAKMKEFSLPEEYDSLKSLKYPRVTSQSGISVSRSPRTNSFSQKRTRKSLRSVDSDTTLVSSTNSPATTTAGSVTSREKRR
ncbi:unnamed protein product [Schistosoma margrebowiei]|uniref:Uncharacterized protein n=1 Tax=Schistosoma margrebowiei TaxID=48269 RepID=A0A183MTP7_9TREM|nr:unnamed protein product [Schistosoma margrebowiei]